MAEEMVLEKSENLLMSKQYCSVEEYRELYEEYKKLFKQVKTLVKIADLTEQELKILFEKFSEVSRIDSLTGLYNRRYFWETFSKVWEQSIEHNFVVSLLMIDIDYFKKYNDAYGHLQGDECLKAMAVEFQRSVRRPQDMVVRFGGEEFVILLPQSGKETAIHVVKRLFRNVNSLYSKYSPVQLKSQMTISVGIACLYPQQEDPIMLLVDKADQELYRAKEAGRNCFRLYERL